ncbi:LOW QUALITY PROTEIN: protein phosphatase 2C-like domain-containing protein 1 [Cyanocitta cristata]
MIHYSIEFLVDNPTPTPYCDLANISNTSKKVSNSLIKALLICQDKNSTWQRDMEDRFIVQDNHESRSDTYFLEILDGCHSVTATETIAAKLPLLFLDQLPKIGTSYKNKNDKEQILDFFFPTVIKADYREKEKNQTRRRPTRPVPMKVYAKSFWRIRFLQLGRHKVSKVHWSGCSVVKIIPTEEIDGTGEEERKHSENNTHSPLARTVEDVAGLPHVAITGMYDVRAALHKNGKSHCLSSTSNVSERTLQNGGNISTNKPGVEGYLRTTSRDPVKRTSVIPVPHIGSAPTNVTCQFLILASNELHETAPKIDKTMPSNSDSSTQLAEKMDSNAFCDKLMLVKKLLKTVSPVGSKPPPQLEKKPKMYSINCKSQAGRDTVSSETLQCNTSPCEQRAQTALAAGSRENMTTLIVLLNGCDKIPNYLNS